MIKEEWKDIPNYEGLYQISNKGIIKNKKGNIIKSRIDHKGYAMIDLSKNNIKHTYKVHRLVAMAFIPNPNNYLEINHIDENKSNNTISNLEWCSHKYNVNYGTQKKRASIKMSLKVNQYDLNNNLIKIWDSMIEASRCLNIDRRSIFHCCKHKKWCKTAGGYKWEYNNGEVYER